MSFKGKLLKLGIDTDALAELSSTELGVINGITAGTVTASKALVVSANKDIATLRNVTLNGNLVSGTTTLSETDLAKIDGITNGTAAAGKALVADASIDIAGINSLTTTTLVATTITQTNVDAGASGTAGTIDVFPATASRGKFSLTCTNQTGDTAVTLNADAMGQATTVHLADPGAAASYVAQSTAALTLANVDVLGSVTAGTVAASKAVVVDANKDVGDFRNLDAVNIDAGTSGTAGSVDIFPATGSKGKFSLTCTDQTGDTTVTLNADAMGQGTTVHVADPGAAASYVVQSTAALTLAEADVLDAVTAGTVAASKAVVADANKDVGDFRNLDCQNLDAGASGTAGTVDVFPTTASQGKASISCTDQTGDTTVSIVVGAMAAARTITLRDPGAAASIMTTTDGTAAATSATAAEVTRACDISGRIVPIHDSASITEVAHEGRILYVTGADLGTYTLPEATGSGGVYRVVIGEVNTSNNVFVVADTTNCNFIGSVNILDLDAAAQAAYGCPANCDTITLNGTTTGGQLGDYLEFIDVATDVWMVFGQLQCPTGSNPATPFSAAA